MWSLRDGSGVDDCGNGRLWGGGALMLLCLSGIGGGLEFPHATCGMEIHYGGGVGIYSIE